MVRRFPNVGTISLGNGLACQADRRVAGQPPSSVVGEYPSSTGSDSRIGRNGHTVVRRGSAATI